MALAVRNEGTQGQFQHQRHPHGGRDAGAADHLHGHHAHVAEGRERGHGQGEQTRRPCRMPTRKMLCSSRSCATARSTLAPTRSTADELTNKVKDRLANKVDKRVFIRADSRAKYGCVVDVVDNVRVCRRR